MNRSDSNFAPIAIGSFPYKDPTEALEKIVESFPKIPLWPQLPQADPREMMYNQYLEGIPGIHFDEKKGKLFADDPDDDFIEKMASALELIMENRLDSFAISRENARGFHAFIENADKIRSLNPLWIKGHVTGPVSFALSILDSSMKPVIYDDTYRELIVNAMGAKALWQLEKLRQIHPHCIIFIDEPYLVSVGSSMLAMSNESAVEMIGRVADYIRQGSALSGVHCCGNTDWSILFDSGCDIISFDSFEYGENFLLYADRLPEFFERGGYIAWGVVPTSEKVEKISADEMCEMLFSQIAVMEKKGLNRNLVLRRSFVSPACGLGNLTPERADICMKLCREISKRMSRSI